MVRLRLKLSRVAASKTVVVSGCTAIAAGTWINFGIGWALIAAGVQAVTYGWLLIDVGQEDA